MENPSQLLTTAATGVDLTPTKEMIGHLAYRIADWHCCDMMMHDNAGHIISIIVKSIFDEHLQKSNVCHLIRYLIRYAQQIYRKSTVTIHCRLLVLGLITVRNYIMFCGLS